MKPEPLPTDFCGWCLRSLIGIERFTILPLAIEQGANPRPRIDRIGGRDVPSLPTATDTDLYRTGHGYAIVLCSEDCARAVRDAVASGETARPKQPQPTARERRRAERLLRSCCAWCFKNVGNGPVVGIYATLQDRRGGSDPPSGAMMTSIMIAGRPVPGFILDPDAGAAHDADVAFMLCWETCADAMREAIAIDQTLSVVH